MGREGISRPRHKVTSDKIAAGVIVTADIADLGVTTAKLAADAVTTAKITDANVTYAKIVNGAGTSVLGKATTGAGVNADITGTDGQVLRVSSTTVGFGTVAEAGITAAVLTGTSAAVVANVNVIGGIPVIFRTLVASGANGDTDITTTHKIRVINAWVVLKGAGTAGCTLQVKSTGNAISDAVDVASGGDRDRFDVGEIDDANHEIAAGGILRWSKASTGADFPGAECYVLAIRVT